MKGNIEAYLEEYKKIPLFYGINDKEIVSMLKCIGGYIKTFNKGQYIILCEESVKSIGVIIEGKVQMIKEDLWGNKSIFTIMNKLELFGETFICSDDLSSKVTFIANASVTVLFMPFNKVMHTCSLACVFHHRLIENMVKLIANKNLQLMDKLEVTSKKTLKEKISAYLSNQAQLNGSKYFTIPLGRVQLADYLCVDRSSLTRELNIMKDEGLIDFEKNTFRIIKSLY